MKIALITGSSRGLGKSMAQHLADRGTDVIVTYQSKQADAEALVKEITDKGRKAVALQLDVGNHDTFDTFATSVKNTLQETWSRTDFDYFVNNAGMGMYGPIDTMKPEDFDQLVNVHLKGPFFLTQKLLPLIKEGGRIVNISSGLTRFSYPGYAAYAMMKGGLEVFTRYLAKELSERRIAVNTIAPGAIDTDFGNAYLRNNPELKKMIGSQTALGRAGLPDDIGGAVSALLSDESGWINGQRIEVSGGISL